MLSLWNTGFKTAGFKYIVYVGDNVIGDNVTNLEESSCLLTLFVAT